MVRAEFLRARNLDFVRAARALGVGNAVIMCAPHPAQRHGLDADLHAVHPERLDHHADLARLPGLRPAARLALAGRAADQGKNNLQAPWLGISGFVVIAVMLSLLVFIGEAVRDAFDPRKTFALSLALLEVGSARLLRRRGRRGRGGATHLVHLERGETLALVGESGSGKSVTALSILQLLPYPMAAHPTRQHPLRRPGADRPRRHAAAQVRGGRIAHDLPGADDLAQPAAHGRAAGQRGAAACTAASAAAAARARTLELLRLVGIPEPETPARRLSRTSSPAASASG